MIYSVPDMSCAHCKAAIEGAIEEVGGRARVSLERREIEVLGLPQATVLSALKAAGYEATPTE